MEESKSILHELYVYSEWKPEPEYIQKPDSLLPENISALWRWIKFLGPKKSLIDSVTAHKERQQKWHIALGDEGKVIAVLTDNILEIRTKRSDYATIAARTTVSRDAYSQWRKLVWSPDCAFVVLAYGNGVVSFFDLTASNLFNIPIDCSRPGGLECTDNTHAVAEIIFMPLRVKDTKWSWEVLIVNYDGKIRGYLVSVMDGFTLHHTTSFSGGVACVSYCGLHSTLYVAGVPRGSHKDKESAHCAGITAWRILNDEPHYKLSVVSDQLEGLANEKFQLYIPFVSAKNLAFIVQMVLSPDGSKLVCLHCNGDISVWRLPLLKLLHRFPLATQPGHDLSNPLVTEEKPNKKDVAQFFASDVNWWSNTEVILSRFSGLVSVCGVGDLVNMLGRAEFLQGAPRVTRAHDAAFLALECETSVLPARRSESDETMEVVKVEEDIDDSMFEVGKELLKSLLFAITDMEAFQPKPRRITCVARVYRLLAVKSTTPAELFSRKIEAGNYTEALSLAETFNLDSDLVYQQQWRRNPVSTDAIQNYLSKVRKKIWAVHQCVDRLPETLAAARELLACGLRLTSEHILLEINKERSPEEQITDHDKILPEHLNAYTSELLRCRHVMLFYKERLCLYESILKFEKSTYIKSEYDRLRSNSVMRSSVALAKEGRIEALTCLWPQIKTTSMKLAVLDKVPETINPLDYQHLVPACKPMQFIERDPALPETTTKVEHDWCRKQIFRSIWSSNWSEETTPDSESSYNITDASDDFVQWYERRAREIEERSGLVSHALHLVTLGALGGGVAGLDTMMFHLRTLDTLVYDINMEGVTLKEVENWTLLQTCAAMMKMSSPETFVADLLGYMMPFLSRYEEFKKTSGMSLGGVIDYLESISVDDLAPILLLLQSDDYKLDVRTHLDLAERCLFAYDGTEQLEIACDILDTILKESDGSIGEGELVRRVSELQRLVGGCSRLSWRGARVSLRALRDTRRRAPHAAALLTRLARDLAADGNKPTQADWEKLLKDILDLQSTLFDCISKEQCYEIYASALLTSGDLASIKLAAGVIASPGGAGAGGAAPRVPPARALHIVSAAAREYFNSASSLVDPALKLAECCLALVKDADKEIQDELDLLAAIQILLSFNLKILPIQVRLCEDKMTLIEKCLETNQESFLKGHELLKLAALLRIAGDDELAREAGVVQLVCRYATLAGERGCAASVAAARRLAALRAAAAAPLVAHVARHAHAHADRRTRRDLYAAAATFCHAEDIEDMLTCRLRLELEEYDQTGRALQLAGQRGYELRSTTDEEFADAVTTPVIERKDLLSPQHGKNLPLFNYLFESFLSSLASGDTKNSPPEDSDSKVRVQEFYQCLYPELAPSEFYYRYDRFAVPEALDGRTPVGHTVLNWFYVKNSLDDDYNQDLESEVVLKSAEEFLYKDTALSLACLIRASRCATVMLRFIESSQSVAALCAALYAAVLGTRVALGDEAYCEQPRAMADLTLRRRDGTEEQLQAIAQAMSRISGITETNKLRALGFNVNTVLYSVHEDYRREVIYQVASSPQQSHLQTALSLADKYSLDPVEVWLHHAAGAIHEPHLSLASLPGERGDNLHQRIYSKLYPHIDGNDHAALTKMFSMLEEIDDKVLISGLAASDHVKLLKKATAASPDLDYKMVIEQASRGPFLAHLLQILQLENMDSVGKFLRTLPPCVRLSVSITEVYAVWLKKFFYSVPETQANSRKWMQQWRECYSFFNKLVKQEFMDFIDFTCFRDDALKRVPSHNRIQMLTQALEFARRQHQKEMKCKKKPVLSWAMVTAEVGRWLHFLETFHSQPVQKILTDAMVPTDDVIWVKMEKSRGQMPSVISVAADLVMEHGLRFALLRSLLQCLRVDVDHGVVFRDIVDRKVEDQDDMEQLMSRLAQYHGEGARFPDALIERVLARATQLGFPPHKQVSLLALSSRARLARSDDLAKVASFTLDLLRAQWPDEPYVKELTEEFLTTEAGRRAAFERVRAASSTLHQKKALVDVLVCWPPVREGDSLSLHCEFLQSLLQNSEEDKESLVYIKILLQRPFLTQEEIKHLITTAPPKNVMNVIWIILLNKGETAAADILALVNEHKDTLKSVTIEEDFIKQLLESQMLVPLVPTVLYGRIVEYIVAQVPIDENPENIHDLCWATSELKKAKYFAEAGHLYLLAAGAPGQLRGFSETVLICEYPPLNDHVAEGSSM